MPEETSRLYDGKFFRLQSLGSVTSAREVVPLLLDIIGSVNSVVDVGCGVGTWLAAFAEHGVEDSLGIDSEQVPQDQLFIPAERFHPHDLSHPLKLDRRFDLAISLEVGEHLDPPRAASFVEDIAALADVVVFSAAIPLQGGVHHVNEQWPSYWRELFRKAGYLPLDVLRPLMQDNFAINPNYRQNMLLYYKEALYEQELKRLWQQGVLRKVLSSPVDYAAPRAFWQQYNVGQEWKRRLDVLNRRFGELQNRAEHWLAHPGALAPYMNQLKEELVGELLFYCRETHHLRLEPWWHPPEGSVRQLGFHARPSGESPWPVDLVIRAVDPTEATMGIYCRESHYRDWQERFKQLRRSEGLPIDLSYPRIENWPGWRRVLSTEAEISLNSETVLKKEDIAAAARPLIDMLAKLHGELRKVAQKE